MTILFAMVDARRRERAVSSPNRKRVSDAAITEAYVRLGSVQKVAAEVGLCHQTVHERTVRLGIQKPRNHFDPEDIAVLKREYLVYRDAGKLHVLAARLGRTKYYICRQARGLGLTDPTHSHPYGAVWKYMPEEVASAIFEKFKRSRLGMGQYCVARGYDDLGFARTMRRFFADEWDHVLELKVPKQSKYRTGRQFEYRVRDALRLAGYFVMRSPASKSPIDLVAVRTGQVLFVQCKRGGSLPPAEWNALFDLAVSSGAIPVFARTPAGRGVDYQRLLARKDRLGRQPMEPFAP